MSLHHPNKEPQAPQDEPVLDLASRLTQDHHQSLKLWLRMLSCTVMIENDIRSRLRSTFGITLPRFDLMAQLERYPQGLRMGELSKQMMVTGGNITGITDQLEQEKLVVRVHDPGRSRLQRQADRRRPPRVHRDGAGARGLGRRAAAGYFGTGQDAADRAAVANEAASERRRRKKGRLICDISQARRSNCRATARASPITRRAIFCSRWRTASRR